MARTILGWIKDRWKTLVEIAVTCVLFCLLVLLIHRAYISGPGQDQAAYIQAVVMVVLACLTGLYVVLTRKLVLTNQSVLEQERAMRKEDVRSRGRALLAELKIFQDTKRFGDKRTLDEFRAVPDNFANCFNFTQFHIGYNGDRIRSCIRRDLAERLIQMYQMGLSFDIARHKAFSKTDEYGRDEPSKDYNHDEWVEKIEPIVQGFKQLYDDLYEYYIGQSDDLG